jgi:5'(3')-deoxyribonucleotidase
MTREIYLDLDGVCVDFNRAAIEAHGLDSGDVLTRWATSYRGQFFTYEVLNMEMAHFFDHLHTLGEAFWIDLEPYPWFETLYERLSEIGHVIFCTTPTQSPACVAGKLHWIQDRFGVDFQDYILTPHKDRLAHANAFLVDDSDRNVERFRSRGGNGVLFPQIWNSNHEVEDDPVEYVIARVVGGLTAFSGCRHDGP